MTCATSAMVEAVIPDSDFIHEDVCDVFSVVALTSVSDVINEDVSDFA